MHTRQSQRATIFVLALTMVCLGEGFFSPKGGVAFPLSMRSITTGQRTAWDLGIEWGGLAEIGVGIGGSFEILWHANSDPSSFDTVSSNYAGSFQAFQIGREVRRILLPPMVALHVDPWYKFFVHPAFHASIGPAMMIYTNREYVPADDDWDYTEHSGVYWGWITRVGADGHVNMKKGLSVFAGFDYQWCHVTRSPVGSPIRYRQDMSGPMIRVGLRVL